MVPTDLLEGAIPAHFDHLVRHLGWNMLECHKLLLALLECLCCILVDLFWRLLGVVVFNSGLPISLDRPFLRLFWHPPFSLLRLLILRLVHELTRFLLLVTIRGVGYCVILQGLSCLIGHVIIVVLVVILSLHKLLRLLFEFH